MLSPFTTPSLKSSKNASFMAPSRGLFIIIASLEHSAESGNASAAPNTRDVTARGHASTRASLAA